MCIPYPEQHISPSVLPAPNISAELTTPLTENTKTYLNKVCDATKEYLPKPSTPRTEGSSSSRWFKNFTWMPISFGGGSRREGDKREGLAYLFAIGGAVGLAFAAFFGGRAWSKREEAVKVLTKTKNFRKNDLGNLEGVHKETVTKITNKTDNLFSKIKERQTVQLALLVTIAVSALFTTIGFLASLQGMVLLGVSGMLIGTAVLLVRAGMEWHRDPVKEKAEKLTNQIQPLLQT